jgi:predicted  nucleic acid-binding Zn-ribbon protein
LIKGLKTKVESEGREELTAYDKYACFCEDTLAGKAKDISDAKTTIDALQTSITKLGAELASHSADIKQLNKDIAENKASQKEGNAVRRKAFKAYSADSTEAKQSIGALSAAIKVLSKTKGKRQRRRTSWALCRRLSY